MTETKALLLASASIIGIFVIGLIGESLEMGITDLDQIDSSMTNKVVHVRGVIKEFKEFSAGIKLLIEQEGYKVSVVYFTNEKTGRKGMCADVVGEVRTTNGALEIEAKSLILFLC